MKAVIFLLAVLSIGFLSFAIAKGSNSISLAWVMGYFTAVLITNIDKAAWRRK